MYIWQTFSPSNLSSSPIRGHIKASLSAISTAWNIFMLFFLLTCFLGGQGRSWNNIIHVFSTHNDLVFLNNDLHFNWPSPPPEMYDALLCTVPGLNKS